MTKAINANEYGRSSGSSRLGGMGTRDVFNWGGMKGVIKIEADTTKCEKDDQCWSNEGRGSLI